MNTGIPFSMHVAGYKYQEIAEKMQLPLGTVKSRIFFARQRLQGCLKITSDNIITYKIIIRYTFYPQNMCGTFVSHIYLKI